MKGLDVLLPELVNNNVDVLSMNCFSLFFVLFEFSILFTSKLVVIIITQALISNFGQWALAERWWCHEISLPVNNN